MCEEIVLFFTKRFLDSMLLRRTGLFRLSDFFTRKLPIANLYRIFCIGMCVLLIRLRIVGRILVVRFVVFPHRVFNETALQFHYLFIILILYR